MGAKGEKFCFSFCLSGTQLYHYELYVVLILPSCTKDRYKKRTDEYTSVEINFLVEVIIP